jgi:hypothetical protein
VILALTFQVIPVQAEELFPLVWDPDGTSLTGARDLGSGLRGLVRTMDLGFDRTLDLPWYAGVPIRVGRFVLIDGPLSMLVVWSQHEFFGHGARAREFGLDPTFHIAVPPPYGYDVYSNSTSWDSNKWQALDLDRRILVITEGQEAEALLVRELVRQSFQAGSWRRTLDTLVFIRLLGDLTRLNTSGDWSDYRTQVRAQLGKKKFLDAWPGYVRWALDPLAWWAFYDYFWCNLVRGSPVAPPPAIPLGPVKLLPLPEWRLAPWGQELGLAALASFGNILGEAELLIGPRDGAPAFSVLAGVTLSGMLQDLDFGVRLGLWGQPRTQVAPGAVVGWKGPPAEPPLEFGGLLEFEFDILVTSKWHLFGMIGAKTFGYTRGRPLDLGFYGQAGVLLRL